MSIVILDRGLVPPLGNEITEVLFITFFFLM